jgi:hypothetical protein
VEHIYGEHIYGEHIYPWGAYLSMGSISVHIYLWGAYISGAYLSMGSISINGEHIYVEHIIYLEHGIVHPAGHN